MLIKELKKHIDRGSSQIIVLAERKITVWYLCDLINDIMIAEGRDDIRTGKLIGKTSGGGVYQTMKMNDKQQREIIEKFKNQEFNILIATTIIEEGLDIPSCDLVIRFDGISQNLRSYVQSKGRARDQNSKFIVMVNRGEKNVVQNQLASFEMAIMWLKSIADDQIFKPDAKMPPIRCFEVEETGAKVSENFSIKFLEEFCKKYPTDQYTLLIPLYETKFYRPGEYSQGGVNFIKGGFLATLKLPKVFKLDPVLSEKLYMKEKHAKEDVSIQAVKELYKSGLLNKYLKPS